MEVLVHAFKDLFVFEVEYNSYDLFVKIVFKSWTQYNWSQSLIHIFCQNNIISKDLDSTEDSNNCRICPNVRFCDKCLQIKSQTRNENQLLTIAAIGKWNWRYPRLLIMRLVQDVRSWDRSFKYSNILNQPLCEEISRISFYAKIFKNYCICTV